MAFRWRQGDTQAFDAVMKMGEKAREMYEKSQAGKAYTEGSKVQTFDTTAPATKEQVGLANAESARMTAADAETFDMDPEEAAKYAPLQVKEGSATTGSKQYGLGNSAERRSAPYTPDEQATGGLNSMQQYYLAKGDHEKALDVGLKARQIRALGQQEQLTQAQINELPNKAALQKLQLTTAERTEQQATDYTTAMKNVPTAGDYVDKFGKKVPKGTANAKPATEFHILNGLSQAAILGGDNANAAKFGLEAGKVLKNNLILQVNKAANLEELNSGAYAEFNNGKNFVQVKNPDGSVSFKHDGDGPNVSPIYTVNKFNENPFDAFKKYLVSQRLDNPAEVLTYHNQVTALAMKAREIDATLDVKKEIALESIKLRSLLAGAAANQRQDAINERRAQFIVDLETKYLKEIPPPDSSLANSKKPEIRAKYESDFATWNTTKDNYLEGLRDRYRNEIENPMKGSKKGGPLGAASPPTVPAEKPDPIRAAIAGKQARVAGDTTGQPSVGGNENNSAYAQLDSLNAKKRALEARLASPGLAGSPRARRSNTGNPEPILAQIADIDEQIANLNREGSEANPLSRMVTPGGGGSFLRPNIVGIGGYD